MMLFTVAALLMAAVMMALAGAALADVCVSAEGETIYDSGGPSSCFSDPTSEAVAVTNSSAFASLDSEAVAVNESSALAIDHCAATALNGEVESCP